MKDETLEEYKRRLHCSHTDMDDIIEELYDLKQKLYGEEPYFEPTHEQVSCEIDGEEEYFEEWVLAKLLVDDVVFINQRKYLCIDNKTERGDTIVVFMKCNDVFAWGCADAENLGVDEMINLYKLHKADKKWGSVKWVCQKRKSQPQRPIIRNMKKDGAWDNIMEALPKNMFEQ